jgi:hypothetical protein
LSFPLSITELFSSPPPASSDIFNDGCSSIGFSASGALALGNCTCLSKSDFVATHDCFSTLDRLNLSRSDVVSVPACIKRFVSLRKLELEDCKQLQEILDLPPNLKEIFAKGCISLESFPQVSEEYQFNTGELPALYWIDLSECYKMHVNIRNLVANSLLGEVCLSDLSLSCVFMGYTLKIHDIYSFNRYIYGKNLGTILVVEFHFLDMQYQTGSVTIRRLHMVPHVK